MRPFLNLAHPVTPRTNAPLVVRGVAQKGAGMTNLVILAWIIYGVIIIYFSHSE